MRRAFLLVLVVAALGAASTAAAAGRARLTVAPKPANPARLMLVAHLPGSTGKPVAFFVVSKEFGRARNVPIGVAKAGAGGARLVYTPTWSGVQTFVAELAHPRARATAQYRVAAFKQGPLAASANPPRPLASVGNNFLAVILTVVGLVWLSLVVTLALAFGWMPRLASVEKE